MLARREAPAADTIDENFDTRAVVPAAQPHVVCGTFVAEGRRHGLVHGKSGVRESQTELGECSRPFVAAMRHGDEVGDGEVAFAIGAVGRGRHGRGVRGPHRGGRPGLRAQMALGTFDRRAERR